MKSTDSLNRKIEIHLIPTVDGMALIGMNLILSLWFLSRASVQGLLQVYLEGGAFTQDNVFYLGCYDNRSAT